MSQAIGTAAANASITIGPIVKNGTRSASATPFYNAGNVTTHYATGTGAANASITGWANVTYLDQCWAQWESWWPTNGLTTTLATTETIYTSFATPLTSLYTLASVPATTEIIPLAYTTTQPILDGDFTVGYSTVVWDDTTVTNTARAATTVTIPFSAETYTITTTLTPTGGSRPNCTLPSSYSKCQSQWEQWATTAILQPPPLPPHSE